MNVVAGFFGVLLGLSSFYFAASGVAIIFDVDLIYGFIIPPVIALIIGFIPLLNILHPIMYIFLFVSMVIGFINIF